MNNFRNAYKHVLLQFNLHGVYQCILTQQHRAASLYASTALGIDKYIVTREKVAAQMHGLSDKFRSKMRDFVADGSKNMIFTEDLKSMVHLGDPSDIDLLHKMVLKFNNQNKELRFGSFIFGPVVMRMFHHLDKPDEALKFFEDPETKGFFDQFMSYQILMDLLYKHHKYDDVLKVFEYATSKQANMTKYPKHLVILALASCYKQNTKESFEYATKLWTSLSDVGHVPMRRAVTFFAALALNQGAPHVALEVVTTVRNQNYVTIRNIKISALAELDRPDDTLPILRNVMDVDSPENVKNTFSKDAIDRVKASVERCSNKDVKREFTQIVKALEDRGLIDDKTIDSLLNVEIQLSLNSLPTQDTRLHTSYQNTSKFPRRPYTRPGLSDNVY